MSFRCLLGHSWAYGIELDGSHIVRHCRRCNLLTVAPAEHATTLLSRANDTEQIQHLFIGLGNGSFAAAAYSPSSPIG